MLKDVGDSRRIPGGRPKTNRVKVLRIITVKMEDLRASLLVSHVISGDTYFWYLFYPEHAETMVCLPYLQCWGWANCSVLCLHVSSCLWWSQSSIVLKSGLAQKTCGCTGHRFSENLADSEKTRASVSVKKAQEGAIVNNVVRIEGPLGRRR